MAVNDNNENESLLFSMLTVAWNNLARRAINDLGDNTVSD